MLSTVQTASAYHVSCRFCLSTAARILFIVAFTAWGCGSETQLEPTDVNELMALIEQRNFFELRDRYASERHRLDSAHILFFEAHLNKAFGDHERSIQQIDQLLIEHFAVFNDTALAELYDVKASNLLQLHRYGAAAEAFSQTIQRYNHLFDSADVADYQNLIALTGALASVPPQKCSPFSVATIAGERNAFNHLLIPVSTPSSASEFIFDTGANFSTIARSQAEAMGMTFTQSSIDVGSSTSLNVEANLAVADSFVIGEITFQKVVFLVLPDEQLTFPELNYAIAGIVGFPVIAQMGEITMYSNGELHVRAADDKITEPNLFLDGLNPVVRAVNGSDTLLFTVDTGARSSELSSHYFDKNKGRIEQIGQRTSQLRGGVGGLSEVDEYHLSNFTLEFGNYKVTLDTIPISLEEYAFNRYFDGNLGQDVLMSKGAVSFNLKTLRLDFVE